MRRACDERELADALRDIEYLCTALRRIVSLDEKNVPKYAQRIAREGLNKLPDTGSHYQQFIEIRSRVNAAALPNGERT